MNRNRFSRVISAAAMLFTFVFVLTFSMQPVSAITTEKRADIICNQKLYLDNKVLCDRIADGIGNLQEQIYVGDLKFDQKRLPYIMKTVIRMHPELFFINTRQFALGYDDKGSIAVICPLYRSAPDEIGRQREVFNTRVAEILSLVDDDMSDFKKALIIHDELVLNCEYSNDEAHPDYVSAYGAIVDGMANCQGYSAAYAYLMSLLGIETEVVESSKLFHIWNTVKIDGEWYNIDVTWDDPLYNKYGRANHDYFLVSDAAIVNIDSETKGSYSFDYRVTKCTSTKYDNADYHKINTRFCYVGEDCYVIDNNYGSENYRCLMRFDPVTGEREILKKFDFKWMSGTTATSYWKSSYMSLEVHDDLLYFNAPDKIYTYDVFTKSFNVLESDGELSSAITNGKKYYGLVINNHDLFVSTAASPNEEHTLTFFCHCARPEIGIGEERHLVSVSNLQFKVICGDANLDGIISVEDATAVQKNIAGIIAFNEMQMLCGDVNGDEIVNIVDCTLIQKFLADLS